MPCSWAGLQFAAAGRHMSDAIAALDPHMAAFAAARNDPDIAAQRNRRSSSSAVV
jgi:hypothetical protein